MLDFDLPGEEERKELVYLYFSKYCDPSRRNISSIREMIIPSLFLVKKKFIRL